MENNKVAIWLLRLAICVSLAYPAIDAFLDPIVWVSFVPRWTKNIVNGEAFLFAFSTFEILLILWLISGKKLFGAAIVSAILMFLITILNFVAFDIVFRDVGLGLAALALATLTKPKAEPSQPAKIYDSRN